MPFEMLKKLRIQIIYMFCYIPKSLIFFGNCIVYVKLIVNYIVFQMPLSMFSLLTCRNTFEIFGVYWSCIS